MLETVLTPSYVYYSAATLDRVVDFFRVPEQLDFSGIATQATTQLERARKLAAQYAAAALQSKPKLRMHLDLQAPKVCVGGAGWVASGALSGAGAHGPAELLLVWCRSPHSPALTAGRWPSLSRTRTARSRLFWTLVGLSSTRVCACCCMHR